MMVRPLKTVYSPLEILTMSDEQLDEIVDEIEAQIQLYRTETRKLEITKEVLEAKRRQRRGEEEVPAPVPRVDLSLPDRSDRFRGVSMEQAVLQVLLEASPGSMHIRRIALALVKNGYGNGRKTAKQIHGSVNTVCANGAKDGKYRRVSSGSYAIAGDDSEDNEDEDGDQDLSVRERFAQSQ